MQFTNIILALSAVAGSALAAPAAEQTQNMMATGQQWTVENFRRTCGPLGKACTYTYGINLNDGSKATQCKYEITSSPPAARASYNNQKCGPFTISSSWSGQFGEGHGFQTLAVVKGRQIIYPSYNDSDLANGNTVKPNKSYTPVNV